MAEKQDLRLMELVHRLYDNPDGMHYGVKRNRAQMERAARDLEAYTKEKQQRERQQAKEQQQREKRQAEAMAAQRQRIYAQEAKPRRNYPDVGRWI